MIYLKVQENEYPAYISGRLIDRDWEGGRPSPSR